MIKFFRKIRQNLLNKKKVGKYLLYAIGEIILVVIGILIALQINNWNEERKSDKQIQLLMDSLVEAVKEDILYLNYTAVLHEFRSNSLRYLLNFSRNNLETPLTSKAIPKLDNNNIWEGAYPDTLNSDFVNKTIRSSGINDNVVINMNVLDELKNSNLFSVIKNDSLKSAINTYYSYIHTSFILDDWNEQLTFSWRTFLRDNYGVLTRSLSTMNDDPLDFVKRNDPVQVRIQEMIGPARFRSNKATKAIALAEDVIREIDKYQKSK
jgi:hypothetical protein